jgi:hypothetical protein
MAPGSSRNRRHERPHFLIRCVHSGPERSAGPYPSIDTTRGWHAAKLPFEIRLGLADDGLRTPKLAPRGGKAPLPGGGDEGAKLIPGYTVEHDLSPKTMGYIE